LSGRKKKKGKDAQEETTNGWGWAKGNLAAHPTWRGLCDSTVRNMWAKKNIKGEKAHNVTQEGQKTIDREEAGVTMVLQFESGGKTKDTPKHPNQR